MVFVDIESLVDLFDLDRDRVLATIEAGIVSVIEDDGRQLVPEWQMDLLIILGVRRKKKRSVSQRESG